MSSVVCGSCCPLLGGCANSECAGKRKLEAALFHYFKFTSFRPGQLETLLPLMHGKDVFARMATGAGKSLCLFLAPLAMGERALGVTISPLNALMDQQVQILSDVGVTAVHVDSHTSFEDVAAGKYRFVFMAPETAVSPPWRMVFGCPVFQEHLAVIAVDEAHCVFEWGAEFRTCFQKIGGLRALTDAPLIAVTATAPKAIQSTICDSLGLKDPAVISQTLDRPNIFLSCSKSKGLNKDMSGLIASLESGKPENTPKTLIFCQTKEAVVKVYRLLLQSAKSRESVSMFHASLTKGTKQAIHHEFQSPSSALRCLVATVAFGMGMDIADIELVVVHGTPDTLSQFYQLCGRAGHNGSQSRAHLFSTKKKISDLVLETYCASSNSENCLREVLLRGLDSTSVVRHNTACCSVCSLGEVPCERLDVLKPIAQQYQKRPPAIRVVTDELMGELEVKLQQERDTIIAEKPSFRILGPQYVCCNSVIKDICRRACYINSVNDLRFVTLLRPEYRSRFFHVIMETVCNAPPAKKQRRK